MKRTRFYLYLLFSMLLSLLAAYAVYSISWQQLLQQRQQESARRLARNAGFLEHEVDKYGLLPLAASYNDTLREALLHAADPPQLARANDYLLRLNQGAGSLQAYLMDRQGKVIASSNWQQKDSFVGRNIAYRPYFQQAAANRITTFYAVGTTGNATGFYLATGIYQGGERLGVVAIKIGLEQLEHMWGNIVEPLLVSDSNGVVVLSSVPEWKYHATVPLSFEARLALEKAQQYNKQVIKPPLWQRKAVLNNQASLVQMGQGRSRHEYLAINQTIPVSGMTLTMLLDTHEIHSLALTRALAVAVMVGFACLLLHSVRLWRMGIKTQAEARRALQRAHDQLEEQVEQRSSELKQANASLKMEIEERIQAARQVENFQNELIRTENLAVIGQLSTGIAHEINQPLAALSALSANTVRFLDINDLATARANLERITDIVARLGALTEQLKSFARRPSGERESVVVAQAVDNALFLLNHRLKKTRIRLQLPAQPEDIVVLCEAVRLEQVLVNLVSNAIDALQEVAEPLIAISWQRQGDIVRIQVRDNGSGLSEQVRQHIFEPFFTTKKTSGLGLGLALSSDIIKAYGGVLSADNHPDGGAVFTITLRQNKQE
ncbi:ATP-binding protein [Aquitalea magnusonii]|uniref:histidine kinase n=1 Tax=Aquitalea magnusonii TaxID=332411 RepID=A0A318JP54_9NEIS|nr:ATP-binding protein [Aquitalea magnusonii]PXX50949.1 two-component system C4-dicarboxylate transport sensor histidine kinase DctB [Aquitalea magnusonii]